MGRFYLFTDGACLGNPGPGGWGAILLTPSGEVHEFGGRTENTTNNAMELQATIEGLRKIGATQSQISIFTDSSYVIRGITGWVYEWKSRGWLTSEGKAIANRENWENLLQVTRGLGKNRIWTPQTSNEDGLIWSYVRGHSGIPGNERTDEIATRFAGNKPVSLFHGQLIHYSIPLLDLPEDLSLPPLREATPKREPLAYISLVDGQFEQHPNWKSCEARVKGRSAAKFKKVFSEEEILACKKEWGVL
jgi:ribonuclease HI